MSAESVARWNAIPLARPAVSPDPQGENPLKRTRQDDNDDDESEDNVSLVSRSPSPTSALENMDLDKYDEYVKGLARETITVDTKINSSNKGFLMLASMGWVEGQPLGLTGDGRIDPVPFYVKNDLTGLGKTSQDVRMIETTVSQRRELDSERQTKETEEQRKAREDSVAKRAAVQSEISTTLRAFYCELCEKQFQNVAQYDEHTNSYAHHHKARFRDMQAAQRASRNTKEELDRRKEKERKREEKELRKIAKAAGVRMAKPPVALVAAPAEAAAARGAEAEAKPGGFKKPGWASIGAASTSSSVPVDSPEPAQTRSGWATVGSDIASIPPGSQQQPPSSSWAPVSAPPTAPSGRAPQPPSAAPVFRTGGWTSLDTGSTVQPPTRASMPPSTHAGPVPPPPSDRSRPSLPSAPAPPPAVPPPASSSPNPGGWSTVGAPSASMQPSRGDWHRTVGEHTPPPQAARGGWHASLGTADAPASQDRGGWQTPSAPQTPAGPPPPMSNVPPPQPEPSRAKNPAARQEAQRSGWQQFRAGAPGRRR
ncbi:hypothetical protein WOLCODRAFT_160076 [Wolfiporia cocos MD-104 SS10]|uniref:G-patch domain-containing protein n=1 Tax=Wolfiporia cocos (strain MD-104) TaxID=742152 RepID=A0A2H3JBW8_WOLCO|nr:hypothetical protein WOLCODRAFT_160076 [Wolfiporia cocos MD-104 SS10]